MANGIVTSPWLGSRAGRTGALLNADCRSCDSLMNYGSRSSNYQVMRVLVSLLWELRFSTSFVTALPCGYL
ncbi:hypothetical protein CISIN_1g035203mg [Citrus sinensis]|uniref:Uncharacterized protein n=1 Tax=Citrus sinensis TaxID=2711 RepID=A0A067H4K3_CITSI|nr:hypothetical protein CISIN_1g035203mg [Citrus sinensis]